MDDIDLTNVDYGLNTGVKTSQYINTITCGNSIDLMKTMEDATVDLVVTSPPYNLSNTTGGGLKGGGQSGSWKNCGLSNGYDIHADNLPHAEYVAWQRDCLTEMMRVLKPGGAIFYNHKWRVQGGLLQDRADIMHGFPVRQIIIWDRGSGHNHNPTFFTPRTEVIYLIAKPGFKLAKGMGAKYGDVWRINADRGNDHPAPFPLELAQRCIECTDAQVVLDPFMGSGTTALAAKMLGRQFIGFELSPAYAAMAEERLAAYPKLGGKLVPLDIDRVKYRYRPNDFRDRFERWAA